MREMVGGCCVCSDERGWTENPLVYCDGKGCNVAVHQACYGIVHVPSGSWFCRKCESQERAARVKCELCPQKEGALKRTDTSGWCHVVCALFIPEAWFGNVQTMEPIILKAVPPERFNKHCYICEEENKEVRASNGACMQCNKTGCKQQFHVTCAQERGLLCEEQGNFVDNVKYCGYCSHHYKKLKHGAIKTIPAFTPIATDMASPESTPEKTPAQKQERMKALSHQQHQQQSITSPPQQSAKEKPKSSGMSYALSSFTQSLSPPSSTSNSKTSSTENISSKFTTANFTETTITPSPANLADMSDSKKSPSSSSKKASDKVVSSPSSTDSSGRTSPFIDKSSPVEDKQEPVEKPRGKSYLATKLDSNFDKADGSPKLPSSKHSPASTSERLYSKASPSVEKASPTAKRATAKSPVSSPSYSYSSSYESFLKNKGSSSGHPANDSNAITSQSLKRPRSKSTDKAVKAEKKKAKKKSTEIPVLKEKLSKDDPFSPDFSPPKKGEVLTPPVLSPSHGKESREFKKKVDCPSPSKAGHSPGSEYSNSKQVPMDTNEAGPSFIPPPRPQAAPSNHISPKSPNLEAASSLPTSMEQLLERQWEQNSQFLMEQGQHFDIASLLNCLHQLRQENQRLEEHITALTTRRDHLLAVNARLSIPLQHTGQQVNVSQAITSAASTVSPSTSGQTAGRLNRVLPDEAGSSGRFPFGNQSHSQMANHVSHQLLGSHGTSSSSSLSQGIDGRPQQSAISMSSASSSMPPSQHHDMRAATSIASHASSASSNSSHTDSRAAQPAMSNNTSINPSGASITQSSEIRSMPSALAHSASGANSIHRVAESGQVGMMHSPSSSSVNMHHQDGSGSTQSSMAPHVGDGDRFWRMPEAYVRGSTVKYLRLPDEVIDNVKDDPIQKSRGRGDMRGRGRGGPGRGGFGGRGRGGPSRGGGGGGPRKVRGEQK